MIHMDMAFQTAKREGIWLKRCHLTIVPDLQGKTNCVDSKMCAKVPAACALDVTYHFHYHNNVRLATEAPVVGVGQECPPGSFCRSAPNTHRKVLYGCHTQKCG